MLIGIRFLLMLAVLASGIALLAYLFTRNPRFLRFTLLIVKGVLGLVVLIGVIVLAERLLHI